MSIKEPSFDEQGLYDIFDHWHIPFWQSSLFFNILIISIILAGGLIAFIAWRKLRKKSYSPAQKIILELARLQKKSYATKQEVQFGYYELTKLLKCFFEFYYHIPLQGMSDLQMLELLKTKPLEEPIIRFLDELIQSSAMIKYAQEEVLQELLVNHLHASIIHVNDLEKRVDLK